MADQLADGRSLRAPDVRDDFDRDRLAIEVDFSSPSDRVVRLLNQVIAWRGKPLVNRPPSQRCMRRLPGNGQWRGKRWCAPAELGQERQEQANLHPLLLAHANMRCRAAGAPTERVCRVLQPDYPNGRARTISLRQHRKSPGPRCTVATDLQERKAEHQDRWGDPDTETERSLDSTSAPAHRWNSFLNNPGFMTRRPTLQLTVIKSIALAVPRSFRQKRFALTSRRLATSTRLQLQTPPDDAKRRVLQRQSKSL